VPLFFLSAEGGDVEDENDEGSDDEGSAFGHFER
jgi:hypothetical protein